jgi:hypothetical protein
MPPASAAHAAWITKVSQRRSSPVKVKPSCAIETATKQKAATDAAAASSQKRGSAIEPDGESLLRMLHVVAGTQQGRMTGPPGFRQYVIRPSCRLVRYEAILRLPGTVPPLRREQGRDTTGG